MIENKNDVLCLPQPCWNQDQIKILCKQLSFKGKIISETKIWHPLLSNILFAGSKVFYMDKSGTWIEVDVGFYTDVLFLIQKKVYKCFLDYLLLCKQWKVDNISIELHDTYLILKDNENSTITFKTTRHVDDINAILSAINVQRSNDDSAED